MNTLTKTQIAERAGITRQRLYWYLSGKIKAPVEIAVRIEKASNGLYKAQMLRRDLQKIIDEINTK